MQKRDYVIKQTDAEGDPIIARGNTNFWVNDEDLVPEGYNLNCVQNTPKLKTIFVVAEEA